VRHAALGLVLLTAACAATPTPSRDELARALAPPGRPAVAPTDITHIACLPREADRTEFACRWRQREDRTWLGWRSYLAVSGDGWHLIDPPERRP
jgi:hypothetical protein